MRELSLHILDIVQNSISANASVIHIDIDEDTDKDILYFSIKDDGKGMDRELLKTVSDPFATTRTTRKVGLGISLLKAAAECCDGGIKITSELGKGTEVEAWFQYSHIDRAPLGDMVQTMLTLIVSNPSIDFVYHHRVMEKHFDFDTREIKKVLDGVGIDTAEVIAWLKEYLTEGIKSLYGGVV